MVQPDDIANHNQEVEQDTRPTPSDVPGPEPPQIPIPKPEEPEKPEDSTDPPPPIAT